MLPFGLVEMLDRVTQRGTRHPRGVLVEKLPQDVPVDSLARFPQGPADRLVNQVVLVGQEQLSDREQLSSFSGPQEVLRAGCMAIRRSQTSDDRASS